MFHRVLLCSLLTILCTLLSVGCGGSKDGKGDGKAPGSDQKAGKGNGQAIPPGAPGKPDYILTAEELTKEFLNNEGAASKKYRQKALEITGEVRNVGSREGHAMVSLQGARKGDEDRIGTFVMVRLLPEFKEKGLHLARKQKVKITCNYESGNALFILGADGSLEEVSKSDIIVISAADLVQE